ncbi:MAG: hypothetical protein QGF00_13610 [Planctomycetota bacterium]|jgi:hypothetical protein|nr:hypothetical protein [Planctomycetota bacterium]MDP7250636.1 hypothetical protein [Planctomycetota bacterium]
MSEQATDAMDLSKIEGSIAELESNISLILVNARKAVKVTGIVAVVVPLVLLLYFLFIFNQIEKNLQPETLIEMGAQMVEGQVPVAIDQVKNWAAEGIPDLIDEYVEQGPAVLEKVRAETEDVILKLSGETLKNVSGQASTQLENILRQNKPEFEQVIEELTSEEGTQIFKLKLKITVEEVLKDEMEKAAFTGELRRGGRLMKDAHKRLKALAEAHKAGKLTDLQKLERRLIVLCKALLLE